MHANDSEFYCRGCFVTSLKSYETTPRGISGL